MKNLLNLLTVLGVLAGVLVGIASRAISYNSWTKRQIMYLSFPGEMYLQMLKGLIIPLLMSSIISAVGALDLRASKKIVLRAISYYSVATCCSVTLGIFLALVIRPGVGAENKIISGQGHSQFVSKNFLTEDTLLDLIRNMFPPNLIEATIAQKQTVLIKPDKETLLRNVDPSLLGENATYFYEKKIENIIPVEKWSFKTVTVYSTNVIGLVVFSITFGIAIGKMGEKAEILVTFFKTLNDTIMIMTHWVIWLSPIGVFFLITAKITEIESFAQLISKLGFYFLTVVIGLCIHACGTLALMYFIGTRQLSYKFIRKLTPVIFTAFGTSSSAATMPVIIQTMDEIGMDERLTRFVVPLNTNLNRDGTALYEAAATIFISQLHNVELGFGSLLAVGFTAIAASIGAAAIPQSGLVSMVMVLDTVGLPGSAVINIVAVDWLLDRCRTTVNLVSGCLALNWISTISKNELEKLKVNDNKDELVALKMSVS